MFDRIKTRLGSEEGFTLIELLVVIIILGILVAIAVPSYLSFRSKAVTASEEANVRSAIPAAESYYNDAAAGNGSYNGLSGANLQAQAPGVSNHVKAVAINGNAGYCIEDTEDNGTTYYDYVGGDPGAALQAGFAAATIQAGDCTAAVGAAGT